MVQNGKAAGERQPAQDAGAWPALREQVAFSPRRVASPDNGNVEPPAWMSRLDRELRPVRLQRPPLTDPNATQLEAPSNDADARALEDLPTSHLAVPQVERDARLEALDDVEQLETRPLQSQRPAPAQRTLEANAPSPSSRQQPQPTQWPSYKQQKINPLSNGIGGFAQSRQQVEDYRSPVYQAPVTPAIPISQPGFLPVLPAAPSPTGGVEVRPQPTKRRGHLRLLIVAVALVVLLIAGAFVWAVKLQLFSVPGVTNTSVAYQNSSLGFSLRYPQGWTAQANASLSSVSFFDANHTDQFNLVLASTSGQTIAQYIKKTTTQLGMTAQKSLTPFTFAGASWQAVQGTVLQSGATYTETLMVTTHGTQFYMLLQMAPATTYSDADHLFFAPARASFQFI